MTLTYVCESCGGTFESDWSEEEAVEEYMENFGPIPPTEALAAVVCDDCYKRMIGEVQA